MRRRAVRHGFTLVEVTAVVLVLGIVAAAVAVKTTNPLGRARIEDVLDQIVHFDLAARTAAARQGRSLQIVIDVSGGGLSCADAGGQPAGPSLSLPSTFRIEKVLTPQRRAEDGQVAIRCGTEGLSSSYGLLVSGKGRTTWVVVFGLTGQVAEATSEQEVTDILSCSRVQPG